MKETLSKFIDSVVAGNEEEAKIIFSEYMTQKARSMLSEDAQQDLFAGKDEKQETKKKFLVKPTGVSYEKSEHAVAAAKNHPDKDVEVVDTEDDKVVYSHKSKKKK